MIIKESLNKSRLTIQHQSPQHLIRYLHQIHLIQSDKKPNYATQMLDLISASLFCGTAHQGTAAADRLSP